MSRRPHDAGVWAGSLPAYRLIALALDTPAGTSGPVRETMLLTAIQTMPTELLRRCAFQPVMLNLPCCWSWAARRLI